MYNKCKSSLKILLHIVILNISIKILAHNARIKMTEG